MVDGVNGDLDHAVRHVVVEYRTILEYVTTLSLHVEEKSVKDPASILSKHVMTITAQVRFVYYHCNDYVLCTSYLRIGS